MIAALKIVAMTVVSAGAPGPLVSPAARVGSAPETANVSQVSASLCTDLRAGWRLNAGESLFSALGGFRLTMQDDGNLVLYVVDDMKLPMDIVHVLSGGPDALKLYAKPIWSTGTDVPKEGKSRGRYGIMEEDGYNALWSTGTHVPTQAAGTGAYCIMKDDGNFVVYDEDDKPCFQTRTKGHPGAFLRCQDDGNLVIYTRDKKAIWQSKTYARLVDNPVPERR